MAVSDPTDPIDPSGPAIDLASVATRWTAEVLPLLQTFARIPCLSPAFDPHWESAGHIDAAAGLLADWAGSREIGGATAEVVRIPGLTPTVLVDVPATDPAGGTVLLYGHYDKQPPFDGWSPGLGPWEPVIDGDRLYARGVADDGYALPSALAAIEALDAAGVRHGRCLVVAEGSEESGSPHLEAVLAHLADRIGVPDLVIALDSSSPTYDRLWITTSLRGVMSGTLTVSVLDHGVHSGMAGAVVPSSFRLVRLLLDRLEDPRTGDLLLPELRATPTTEAAAAAAALAEALAEAGRADPPFPLLPGLVVHGADATERALRTAWSGSLAVVGADGLPPAEEAGAVLRPSTSLKLVLRIPPTADPVAASAAVARTLTTDPPHGATVAWSHVSAMGGFLAPPLSPWLERAVDDASEAYFGKPSGRVGEGGTIPFTGLLADRFPGAQILPLGVLGPDSNAHGPDESLHLPTASRITACVAALLAAEARHGASASSP